MTFNDEFQLFNGTGPIILFQVLNRINDLLHFLTKDLEEDFFFVRKEIIDIGWSATVGNSYITHTGGVVAFFPEKPSCCFQHLRLLKTGSYFASGHPNQIISKRRGPMNDEYNNKNWKEFLITL